MFLNFVDDGAEGSDTFFLRISELGAVAYEPVRDVQ